MKKSDFYYELPTELIAQQPAAARDRSRLLSVEQKTGAMRHGFFYEIPNLLKEGDLLVLNNSKVFPARLEGVKTGTGSPMQFLLLSQQGANTWEILVKPGKRAKPGAQFSFGDGMLKAEILDILPGGNRTARFFYEGDFFEVLSNIGQMPLPEYIHETPGDLGRYQTVYAKETGSAAAPTAGLHFTPGLFKELEGKGVKKAFVTLHVGLGTFRPVKEEQIENHFMHREFYEVPDDTARMVKETKQKGGRVIAVGTTSCRTLESSAQEHGEVVAGSGSTDIFLYPGAKFHVIDGLITNFHLPESTLIMLVSAFLGHGRTMAAYREAVEQRYRFFSFGDAMLIL